MGRAETRKRGQGVKLDSQGSLFLKLRSSRKSSDNFKMAQLSIGVSSLDLSQCGQQQYSHLAANELYLPILCWASGSWLKLDVEVSDAKRGNGRNDFCLQEIEVHKQGCFLI